MFKVSPCFRQACRLLTISAAFLIAVKDSRSESSDWMPKSQQMLKAWLSDEVVVFNLTIQVEQVAWKRGDGKLETFSSRTAQAIRADIDALNRDFAPAKIGFRVKRVVLCRHEVPFDPLATLAHKAIERADTGHIIAKIISHPIVTSQTEDAADISYVFGMGPGVSGLAEVRSHTGGQIWISGSATTPHVLSHEMGHHFGLTHTFDENGDDVDDTPQGPGSVLLLGGDMDPNKDNIMTYSEVDGRKFTLGQMDKMRRHACAWLSSEQGDRDGWSVCNPDPDDMLKIIE